MSLNPTIQLVPNSFYIATSQLDVPQKGNFHWSIFITDSTGAATKYHWVRLPAGMGKAEGVVIVNAHPVSMYSEAGIVNFCFFRIAHFIPLSDDYMRRAAINAFNVPHTSGYITIQDNRRNNLSCRTWALTVYAKLQVVGMIDQSKSDKEIEKIITEASTELQEEEAQGLLEISRHINL